MFYSGWQFPTPQRLEGRGSDAQSGYLLQNSQNSSISFVHFLPSGDRRQLVRQRETGSRIHLKSDVSIHPNSGVFYFEVEVQFSGAAGGGGGGGGGGGASEPALVIGVCRRSLPSNGLPGEEANSVGLFTSQRMVYANGKREGEVVRFPTGTRARSIAGNNVDNINGDAAASGENGTAEGEEQEGRRFRGLRVGDTVGCIVNLLDGTVRFTFNGEILDFTAVLSRRTPKHGYYAAVGVFRRVPPVAVRVIFPSVARQTPIPQPISATGAEKREDDEQRKAEPAVGSVLNEAASRGGYFNFDIDGYCEDVTKKLVLAHLLGKAKGPVVELKENECTCRDTSIVAAICKHLAARGMTSALSAFEKEQQELTCAKCGCGAEPPEKADAAIPKHVDPTSEMLGAGTYNRSNGDSLTSGTCTESESRTVTYSAHIRRLREDVANGRMSAAVERTLSFGLVSPGVLEKVRSCVENVDALLPDCWGLLFFAQRCDILFLLRVTHLVELSFDTMQRRLEILLRNVSGEESIGRNATEDAHEAETTTACPFTTAAELMEFAHRFLLEPMRSVASTIRQHRNSTTKGPWTSEVLAFGSFESSADEGTDSFEELAAHLFVSGRDSSWSGPEAPATLLVRHSVPNVPAPKSQQQRHIVQTLATLISHQRAVCARAERYHKPGMSYKWAEEWLVLVEDTRRECRTRCTSLLLHAIEDFNGALEHRLVVWTQRQQQRTRGVAFGGSLEQHGASVVPSKSGGKEGENAAVETREVLFPSLRSAWRHVHAAAALEPLLQVVTKAFSDQLNRVVVNARLMAESISTKEPPSTFCKGPKRGILHSPELSVSGADKKVAESNGSSASSCEPSVGSRTAPVESERECVSNNSVCQKRMACYTDDLRMSFLYMKSVYRAVFA